MGKKLTTWLCLSALIIGLLAGHTIALAADARDEEADGGTFEETAEDAAEDFAAAGEAFSASMIACAKAFPTFITSTIDMGNFSTYWVDIFEKNMCQLDDLFALDDEIDKIMEDVRSKYYSCDLEGVEELEQEYKNKKIEVHFVRNVVDLKTDTLGSDDIGSALAAINIYIATTLYDEMYDKYVEDKSWVTFEEFDELFYGWWEDYQDNIENYLDCTGGSWESIAEKWEDMTSMFEDLKPEKEDFEIEFEKDPDKKPGVKFGAESNFDSYLDSFSDLEKVEIENPGEYVVTTPGTGLTEALDLYVDMNRDYFIEIQRADLLGRYQTLYGAGGADISDSFMDNLKELDATLHATIDPTLTEVTEKTYDIAKKQCDD